jgi:hypothetical protein
MGAKRTKKAESLGEIAAEVDQEVAARSLTVEKEQLNVWISAKLKRKLREAYGKDLPLVLAQAMLERLKRDGHS